MIVRPIEGLDGAFLIEIDIHEDRRGFLSELWGEKYLPNDTEWKGFRILQENLVKSSRGSIRGIHRTTKDSPQRKVLVCLQGEIEDYLIDLRPESKSFKKIFKIPLNGEILNLLFIPARIGHSFQTISDTSLVCYYFDRKYNPDEEISINPFDKEFDINWIEPYIVSEKDQGAFFLENINRSEL